MSSKAFCYAYNKIQIPYYGLKTQHDLVPAFPTSSQYFFSSSIKQIISSHPRLPTKVGHNGLLFVLRTHIHVILKFFPSHLECFSLECCPHPPRPQSLQVGSFFSFKLHPSNRPPLIIYTKVSPQPLSVTTPFQSSV